MSRASSLGTWPRRQPKKRPWMSSTRAAASSRTTLAPGTAHRSAAWTVPVVASQARAATGTPHPTRIPACWQDEWVPSAVTIGVYGFSAESFLEALLLANVRQLLDVRQRRG